MADALLLNPRQRRAIPTILSSKIQKNYTTGPYSGVRKITPTKHAYDINKKYTIKPFSSFDIIN